MSSIQDIRFKENGVCSKDHLTDKGIHQLAQLGKELRKIYEAQLADGVSVNTTWTQRTYWSAVALMSGLLDSRDPKCVIHSKPLKKDGLIHVYSSCDLVKEQNKATIITEEFQSANASLVEVAKNYGLKASGHPLAAYFAVDNLRCLDCHQMPLPNSNSDKSIIYKAMDEINKAVYFPTSPSDTVHRMRIGAYLKDLKQRLQQPRNIGKPKFFYTSAHDSSLSSLLSSLNFTNTGTPPYASNFIIEYWIKKGVAGLVNEMRFIYNGKYVNPSWCEGNYCTLEKLRSHLDTLGIHLAGNSKCLKEFNFESECNLKKDNVPSLKESL
ncbi:hypothetical protein DSO57_1003461 [Entomophthora muscae]|uniref:Uncharacterized protein n=1 Tax=Entomophthora muscae TaxID=34485 RepID=A0ACC2UTH2_9FUNG|nr:hypothetical protein DSO57_1003461 [Entomophthora muscae]